MSADNADDREAQQPSDDGVIVIDEVSSSASDEDTNQDSSRRFQRQALNKINVTTLVVCICIACMIATAVQIGRHNMSSRISSINNDQHHQEVNHRSVSNLNVDDDEIIIIMNPNKISNPNKMPEQHLTMDNDDILIKVDVTLTPTDSPSLSASTPIIPSPWPSTTAPTELTTTSAPVVSFLPMPISLGQDHWIHEGYGLQVSAGISVKLIAMSGARVPYANGDESFLPYHTYMDGAGIISLPNNDGYVYVSNSETESNVGGGVYGLYFDNDGQVVDYKALLTGTTWNCGGGLSPWNTWISCEERPQGQCWQIDPDPASEYHTTPRETLLGGSGGRYESVAVDNTNPYKPIFFLTEDHVSGALRRFIADGNGWDSLHVGGTITFLYFYGDSNFDWTTDEGLGRQSAAQYYPETEGISYHDGQLYFVTKTRKALFILDLTNMTYKQEIVGGDLLSGRGSFNSQPDQIVFANIKKKYLYFTEDGGRNPGVFARDESGTYYTIFQGIDGYYLGEEDGDETVGVALTPDRQKLYAGIQDAGILFEFTRDDGMPFE